jgi:hypothetical protein
MVDIQRLWFTVLEQEAAQNKLDVSDVNEGLNSRMDKLGTMFVKIFNVVSKEKITVPDIWSFFWSNWISWNDIKSVVKGGKFNVNVKRDSDRDTISKGLDLMSTWLESNAKEIWKTPTLINDVNEFNTQRNDLSTFIGSENVSRRAWKKLWKLQKGILKWLSDNENKKWWIDVAKIDIDKTQAIVNLVDQQSLTTVWLTYKIPNATLISPWWWAILHFNQWDLSVWADNKIKWWKALIGKTHLAIQNPNSYAITFEKLKVSTDFECKTPWWTISDLTPSLDATWVLSYGMKFTNGDKNFNATGLKSDGTLTSPFVAQDTKNEYTLTWWGRNFEITEKPLPVQPEDPTPAPWQLDEEDGQDWLEKVAIPWVLDLLAKINVDTSPINNLDDTPGHKEWPVTYLQKTLKILDDSTDPRFTWNVIERDATHTDTTNFVDNDFGPRTFASVENLQEILFGEGSDEIDGLFGKKTKAKLEMELWTTSALVPKTSSTEAVPRANDGVADEPDAVDEADLATDVPQNPTVADPAAEVTDAGGGDDPEVTPEALTFEWAISKVKADVALGKAELVELRKDTEKWPSFALLDDILANESGYNKVITGAWKESWFRIWKYSDDSQYIEIWKFENWKSQTTLSFSPESWDISSYDAEEVAIVETSILSSDIEADPEPDPEAWN